MCSCPLITENFFKRSGLLILYWKLLLAKYTNFQIQLRKDFSSRLENLNHFFVNRSSPYYISPFIRATCPVCVEQKNKQTELQHNGKWFRGRNQTVLSSIKDWSCIKKQRAKRAGTINQRITSLSICTQLCRNCRICSNHLPFFFYRTVSWNFKYH